MFRSLEYDVNPLLSGQDLIEKGEKQPNLTIGILVSVVVVFLTIFFRLIFGGKKKPVSSETLIFFLVNFC